MCLATRPRVLLLDEPLAGMGAEETERMLALLRRLKRDHAILLVEHDMDAVFRVADRITVMVNGAGHRQRRAGSDPQPIRRCRRAYLGEGHCMSRCRWRDRALHTYYGDSHVLHGVDLAMPAGSAVGLLGPQRHGQDDADPHADGLPAAARRPRAAGTAATSPAAPPERMARLGIGYVPEGRGIFPNLSVRENLVMAARAGVDGAARLDVRARAATRSRAWPRGSPMAASSCRAASSRCSSIGRALMTNPELLILDEATEGLAPLVVAEIWRVIGADPPRAASRR